MINMIKTLIQAYKDTTRLILWILLTAVMGASLIYFIQHYRDIGTLLDSMIRYWTWSFEAPLP